MNDFPFHQHFLDKAIKLSEDSMSNHQGGPFGAIITKDNRIISEGYNQVTKQHDPTAHAEVVAIRQACLKLNDFRLVECILYSSCEPCPMCFAAIYWARISCVYYAAAKDIAFKAGFDDAHIAEEFNQEPMKRKIPFIYKENATAMNVLASWRHQQGKIEY